MKRSLLAFAVLGAFTGAASAQTAVTIYGVADVGLVLESGNPAGSVAKLTSGVSAGSRVGFRGTEYLGGGMSALFTLETGMAMDTGGNAQGQVAASTAGLAFARQAFAGLSGNFGTVTAGRQYNPYFLTVAMVDPFNTGLAGQTGNLMTYTGSNGRTNNSVKYASPNFGGFTGELMYAFGEVIGDNSAGRIINGAIGYANGPFAIRFGHQNQNNAVSTINSAKNTILAATYDFGPAKLHAAYAAARGVGSIATAAETVGFNAANGTPYRPVPATATSATDADVRDFMVGATIPFGASKVLLSYIRRNDRNPTNQDANQIAVGYEYSLSKRTTIYSAYSRISNSNGAGYTVANAGDVTAGSGDKAFNLGIRHTF